MKATTRVLMLVAAGLIAVGAVCFGVSYAMGARPQDAFSGNMIGISFVGDGYRDLQSPYQDSGIYDIDADAVSSISLDWSAGEVQVAVSPDDQIHLTEQGARNADQALRYGVENGTLYVQYCKRGLVSNLPIKDLTVALPAALLEDMREFSFDGASASLTLQGLQADDFEFDAASGGLQASDMKLGNASLSSASGAISFAGDCSALEVQTTSGSVAIAATADYVSGGSASGKMTLSGEFGTVELDTTSGSVTISGTVGEFSGDTASGDVALQGTVGTVEVDTTSGTVLIDSSETPRSLEIETASGAVTLAIPKTSGFTLQYDTASGNLNCSFPAELSGGSLRCGDGAYAYEISTVSGNLTIRTAE